MSAATSSIASAGEVWPPPSCSGPPATSGSSHPICPTSKCARARSATRRASGRRWRASPTSSIAPGQPRPAGLPSFTRSTRPGPAMSSPPSTGKQARCSGWCIFRAWPPRDLPCGRSPRARRTRPSRFPNTARASWPARLEVRNHCRADYVILRPPPVYGPRDAEFLRLFRAVKTHLLPRPERSAGLEPGLCAGPGGSRGDLPYPPGGRGQDLFRRLPVKS